MEQLSNGLREPTGAADCGKRKYTTSQQWLLLGALALGIVGDWLLHANADLVQWVMWLFWVLYGVLFYLLNGKNNCPYGAKGGDAITLYRCKETWFLAAAATITGFFAALWGTAYNASPSEYGLEMLMMLNLVAIPCIWMLHKAFSVGLIARGEEWMAVQPFFRGFFVEPFLHIGQFFGAIGSLFHKNENKKNNGVMLGLAVGIPLTAVVLYLLASADAMMAKLLNAWLGALTPGVWIGRGIYIAVVGMLFYSFLYDTAWGKPTSMRLSGETNWPGGTLAVPLILLSAVYGLFAYVQFQYFFGGALPASLTYSAYAREGFGQLITVSLINFSLIGLTVLKTGPARNCRWLCLLLLAFTGLLLYSAFLRLKLYIDTYGLTMMRILPLWLMAYLGVLAALTGVRLFTKKLRVVPVAGALLIVWYLALNIPNWAAVMTAYRPVG